MIDRRLELFNGKYTMPTIKDMKAKDSKAYRELEAMFNAMWNSYLVKGTKGSISLPYWAQRVQSPKLMNIALKLLSENGYITVSTRPSHNWSEASLCEDKLLEYVTKEELSSIRKQFKFQRYMLNNSDVNEDCQWLTSTKGTISNTGLHREGFMKAGKTEFMFDVDTMLEWKDEVVSLVNYGIEKTLVQYPNLRDDLANYGNVGLEVVEYYLYTNGVYNSGTRYSDPRGRDIAGYLSKIGNPVGYKIMRSLLVIPEEYRQVATNKGLEAKYLFIAELAGYKAGTIAGKIAYGKECYEKRYQHELNLMLEHDLKELPENIWLMRLYKDIDGYISIDGYKWTCPIELDASASIKSYYGLLLGHKPYLVDCNVIVEDDVLNDAWSHDVIKDRKQAKSVMRVLYGSKQPIMDMWLAMGIKGTREEAIAMEKDITTGHLAPANRMKEFMANNANMSAEMNINIWNEKFTVQCNKFYNRGETTIKYDFYDSHSKSVRRIHHTDTIKVPNLQRFKIYTSTLLIHHLDSRSMDVTCNVVYDAYQWCLPIHDAQICDCEATDLARETYAKQIELIYRDRNGILTNYFRSIGIQASAIQEWQDEVMAYVEPVKEFKCSKMVLK